MTLGILMVGLVVWVLLLVTWIGWACVKLSRQYDPRTVQVLPIATVTICFSLILFFFLRALFHV